MAGANLVFFYDRDFAQEDPDMQAAWESFSAGDGGKADGVCLVTGQKAEIARIHGMIKGLPGAQSSGAALVSFNAPAFGIPWKIPEFHRSGWNIRGICLYDGFKLPVGRINSTLQ